MTETTQREATVVLRDGSTVAVRPILASDEPELARFFSSLSLESRVFRFFAAVANANASAKAMANVDYKSRSGLVALAGTPARIVGHAMYAEMEPKRAEVAFAVADPYQGSGRSGRRRRADPAGAGTPSATPWRSLIRLRGAHHQRRPKVPIHGVEIGASLRLAPSAGLPAPRDIGELRRERRSSRFIMAMVSIVLPSRRP